MGNLIKWDELLKYQTITIALSILVIAVGLAGVGYRGGFLYGIEFTGGLKLEFEFTKPIDAQLLQTVRNSLQEDGSSVRVKTFGLAQEEENRGLMVTVRARQMVTNLTDVLYRSGGTDSESLFKEIANRPSVRWIDADTLRDNFRIGEGESDKIDISRGDISRELIRSRVQSIVNKTLIQEIVSQLRSSLVESSNEIDLNWASSGEIEQWIEQQQLNAIVNEIMKRREQGELNGVSDLRPVLSRFNVDFQAFDNIFSVGRESRDQLDLTDLDSTSLKEIIREEFIQGQYESISQRIVDRREEKGLFKSKSEFFQLEFLDPLYLPALRDSSTMSPFVMIRSEMVSPSIGSELIGKSALAIFISLFGILIYLYIRFELTYSLGAIAAIVHDVVITLGLLTLVGVEFDVSVVAAVLTVIGYSLNDTIVNFDRVRENRSLMGYKANWYDVINRSVYEVLNRTFVTSITTFLAVFVLYWFGGIALRAFSITLIIGIVVGTYSSIFVSNLSLYHLQKSLRST